MSKKKYEFRKHPTRAIWKLGTTKRIGNITTMTADCKEIEFPSDISDETIYRIEDFLNNRDMDAFYGNVNF